VWVGKENMNIKSRKGDVVIEALIVTIPENEIKSIVTLLSSIRKRAKLDRMDEFIINKLVYALEHPEQNLKGIIREDLSQSKPETFKQLVESPKGFPIDKKHIIEQVKSRVDPRGEKDLQTFVRESIAFAQKDMGITTVPKDATIESFYDFLVGNKIINSDGTPSGR